jgi:hypothetical protein
MAWSPGTVCAALIVLALLLDIAESHCEVLRRMARDISERKQAEERVWADPHLIGQVLRNLLANAAKYSPDGAHRAAGEAGEDRRAHPNRGGRPGFRDTSRWRRDRPDRRAANPRGMVLTASAEREVHARTVEVGAAGEPVRRIGEGWSAQR